MPSIKDLKKRITSVKNTQQTTRAMKMVSAAKLRRAQDAITANRPYAKAIDRMIRRVISISQVPNISPLIRDVADEPTDRKKNVALVVISSDRGLCGAFNGNIIKRTNRWVAEHSNEYDKIYVSFVGKKAHELLRKNPRISTLAYVEFGAKADFAKAEKLTDQVVSYFLEGKVDEVKVIYNEFKNAISQELVVESFLPITTGTLMDQMGSVAGESMEDSDLYIVRPDGEALLKSLVAKHFSVQMYRMLLESQASEHGARMSAMDSATRNAGEMIRKLSLQYNKQRQAAITKELLEIISGSESQKTSA